MDDFALTIEQTDILLNIEYLKAINDAKNTKINPKEQDLKYAWIKEWGNGLVKGFPYLLKTGQANLMLKTDSKSIVQKIKDCDMPKYQFQLILLQSMIFEPYYPLSIEVDDQNRIVPNKDYCELKPSEFKDRTDEGDDYLDGNFSQIKFDAGYLKKVHKYYNTYINNLCGESAISSRSFYQYFFNRWFASEFTTRDYYDEKFTKKILGFSINGLTERDIINVLMAYVESGIVATTLHNRERGMVASLGRGNTDNNEARLKKEKLLISILELMNKE